MADSIIEDLKFGTWKEPSTFANLPKATDGNSFYHLLEPFALRQRIDSLKRKLSPNEWKDYQRQNSVLTEFYGNSSLTRNPVIVKLNPN